MHNAKELQKRHYRVRVTLVAELIMTSEDAQVKLEIHVQQNK